MKTKTATNSVQVP